MPRKTRKAAAAVTAAPPSIPKELIDQFFTGPMSIEAVHAASMAFKKALIKCAAWGPSCLIAGATRLGRPGPRRPATTAAAPAARWSTPTTAQSAETCRRYIKRRTRKGR